MILYNAGMWLYRWAVGIASLFNDKAKLWVRGRRGIARRMREAIGPADRIVWVHCASLGEFEQGRPLIEAIREQQPGRKILLTFFSPSGYEIRKDYPGADYVFYLPADTPGAVRRFLDTARPEVAVFVKYEYWLNYLKELDRRDCKTYIVSAIFRRDSVFFRWYGGAFRRALGTFDHIFVQDDESQKLLGELGMGNVTVAGDTRFDRVADIAGAAPRIEAMERFAQGNRIVVAGSTWPADEELVVRLIEARPEMKYVIAPHEMDRERIERLAERTGGLKYTEYAADIPVEHYRVLIVDTIGILSSLYRYAWCAYIGGGFGAGIHNTLEAATFGLPVAFGPNYGKFREARDMVGLGIARSVSSAGELIEWAGELGSDPELYEDLRGRAAEYVGRNRGATQKIMTTIFG